MTTTEELALQTIIDRCNETTWRVMRDALVERDRLQAAIRDGRVCSQSPTFEHIREPGEWCCAWCGKDSDVTYLQIRAELAARLAGEPGPE